MSSNLVIVAIPDENDHVWKVSSEKIPHLTLLFLGEVDNVSNLDDIVQFVEHAANTTLRRFYLTVDRRGELGEDKADVLFFKSKSYDAKSVQNFRNALLKDNNIRTAHDLATQHEGPWNPHLTMGYPETPAKKDERDFGFYEVGFNKIAVWTDEFDGPEFLLKDYWEEFEEMETMPVMAHAAKVSDTPWSQFKDSDYDDAQYARACLLDRGEDAGTAKQRYGLPVREPDGTVNRNACHAAAAVLSSKGGTGSARGQKVKGTPEQIAAAKKKLISLYKNVLDEDVPAGLGGEMKQTDELGADFILEHYGVKGMRWGVRREDVGGAARSVGRAAKSAGGAVGRAAKAAGRFAGDVAFELDVDEGRAREAIISKAGPAYQKTDLPALKARHGDYGKLRNRAKKPFSKEARAYRKDAKETYIKRLETTANSMKNVSGDRQYTIRERGLDQPAEGGALPRSKYYWEVTSRRVQHAVEDKFTRLEVIFDDEGWITDLKPVPMDEAMAQTVELGEEFLVHFGVKGMRWGQRKTETVITNGTTKMVTPKKAEKLEKQWEKNQFTLTKGIERHNASADHFNSKIGSVNDKFKGDNFAKEDHDNPQNWSPRYSKYMGEIRKLQEQSFIHAVEKVHGSSPTGKRKASVETRGDTLQLVIKDVESKARHAAIGENDEVFLFKITRDGNGFITTVKPIKSSSENEMAQSMDLGSVLISSLMEGDTLEHYGVKGMRWGVRKAQAVTTQEHIDVGLVRRQTKVQAKGGQAQPASPDAVKAAVQKQKLRKSGTAALSNQELRELQNRLQLEAQVEMLATRKGKKFVSKQLEETGRQELQTGLRRGARRAAPHVIRKAKKGAATAAVTALL